MKTIKIENGCSGTKKGTKCAVEITLPHSITDKTPMAKASS